MYRLPLLLILAALLLAPPAARAQATEPVGTVSDSETEVSRAYDNPSAFFDDTAGIMALGTIEPTEEDASRAAGGFATIFANSLTSGVESDQSLPVDVTFDNSKLRGEDTPERFRKYECHPLRGVITHYEPPHKLGYTWGEDASASEVIMELQPAAKGNRPGSVLLIVTHQKLSGRDGMINVSSGWHTHLGVLAEELGAMERRPFWERFLAVEQEYAKRIPGLS